MTKWIFSPEAGDKAISTAPPEYDIVFYIDNIKPEVITRIVEIQNDFCNSDFLAPIEVYLLDESDVDQEEREFILENIINYVNIKKVEEQQIVPPVTEVQKEPVVSQAPIILEIPVTNIAAIIPGFATEPGSPAPVEKQKRAWVRKTTDTKAPVKMQSTEDFIKIMQEKIEMARMLDSVELPELPGSMTKANRDVMVEFQKEHAAMIAKYMQKIQQA